jgi:hypothetical protein
MALMNTQDYTEQLEGEYIYLLLLNEASKGMDDVVAQNEKDARQVIKQIKHTRCLLR